MATQADIQDIVFSSRARLLAFEQLLRLGVNVYVPVTPGEGIDALVRGEDGRYLDLIVRPAATEHDPTWFIVPPFEPRQNLVIVCVGWALTPLQAWIIPSAEFYRLAERLEDGRLSLNLETTDPATGRKRKVVLSQYRNAWRLIAGGAVKSLIAY